MKRQRLKAFIYTTFRIFGEFQKHKLSVWFWAEPTHGVLGLHVSGYKGNAHNINNFV